MVTPRIENAKFYQ